MERGNSAGTGSLHVTKGQNMHDRISMRDEDLGSSRRIGSADTSGDWDEAMPPVGGNVRVQGHHDGYRFSVRARIDVTIITLIDVVEVENTFHATVSVGIEWEISEDQWRNCESFWLEHFLPKAVKVFFKNSEERANIFGGDDEARANAMVGKDELGSAVVDAGGRPARLFRLRRRATVAFRQALDLKNYPFDMQCLCLQCETEGEMLFGKYFKLELGHPLPCAGNRGRHRILENADNVDDVRIETIFALSGAEVATQGQRPRLNEYTVLLFVSRQYTSTMWNAVVPTFMIEVLSLMVYWVPPCDLADRASVTLTLFLTAVSFKSYMSDRLPAVPYLTAVEVYLFNAMAVLLIQGILLIGVAKFCNKGGFAGQANPFGYDRDPFDDDVVADDDEGPAFWYESDEARTRVQNRLDAWGFALTFVHCGVSFVGYIFLHKYLRLYRDLSKLHANKAKAEGVSNPATASFAAFFFSRHPNASLGLFRGAEGVAAPRDPATLYGKAPPRKRPWFALRSAKVAAMSTARAAPEDARKVDKEAIAYFRERAICGIAAYSNEEMTHSTFATTEAALNKRQKQAEMAAYVDRRAQLGAESHKCVIFDIGTGEAKTILCSFIERTTENEKPAVLVEDMAQGSFLNEKGGKIPVRECCMHDDVAPFEQFVEDKLAPRLVLEAGKFDPPATSSEKDMFAAAGFWAIAKVGAPKCFEVKQVKKDSKIHVGSAVVSCNGADYDVETAFRLLNRVATLDNTATPEVLDRVEAKRPLRYSTATGGDAVPLGDTAAPDAIVLPGDRGTVVADHGGGHVAVEWDGRPELGKALVALGASVAVVPEVRFGFWSHVVLEGVHPYAKWRGPKVVFGAGAWYRNESPEIRNTASALFSRLADRYDGTVVRLTDLEESVYEERSVLYAHRHMRYALPDALLAVGNGSTQFSCISAPTIGERVQFVKEHDHGVIAARRRVADGTHPDAALRSSWSYDVFMEEPRGGTRFDVPAANVFGSPKVAVRRTTAPYLIQLGNKMGRAFFDSEKPVRERQKAWREFASSVIDAMVYSSELSSGTAKTVFCMSACYYAADFAGVPVNPETVKAADARATYEEKLEEILVKAEALEAAYDDGAPPRKASVVLDLVAQARLKEGKAKKNKKEDLTMNLSNLTYQILLCDMLGPDVELRIARDWKLPYDDAKYKFRTTWSSGWYLDYLVRQKTPLLAEKETGFEGLI